MNSLIILFIFIIIVLSSYLIYRNYQDYSVLEKFSTQSSLSTYFKNTIDSDDYQTYTNTFNGMNAPFPKKNINKPAGWNGSWSNNNVRPKIYAQFLQVNDKLIVVLTKLEMTPTSTYVIASNTSDPKCRDIFIGIASLNKEQKMFRITNVICNSLTVTGLGIGNREADIANNKVYFTGTISGNTITLLPNPIVSTNPLTLTLDKAYVGFSNQDYPYLSKYMHQISPFLQENPITQPSTFEYTENSCSIGTSLCKDTDHGFNDLSYTDENGYNACCNDTTKATTCFLNTSYTDSSNANLNIPQCTTTSNMKYYQNYNAQFYLMEASGSSLKICNSLSYFTTTGRYAILCYVTNLKNVQTLSYQFFGVKPSESSLTLQYDKMNNKIQDSLSKYKPPSLTNKGLSFTNCLETQSPDLCIDAAKKYIDNILPTKMNDILPTVWEINSKLDINDKQYNIINSCPFRLNTPIIENQKSVQKYVECNDNGTINLSLYGGGNNQNLYMQDATILQNVLMSDENSNKYYAVTTNIRANNGLYLVPSNNVNGFYNNSTQVSLMKSPEPNGKWLILGFDRRKPLADVIKNYTF